MADLVGKNYATDRPVAVAVDANGVIQVASAGAAQSAIPPTDVQQLRNEIAALRSEIATLTALLQAP